MNNSRSAEIIAFPLKTVSCIDQQRWIPAPQPRRADSIPILGYLRLGSILVAALLSWVVVIGFFRGVSTILQG